MNAETAEIAARVVNEVVAQYAFRVRAWCDERDLAQHAWEVVMTTLAAGGHDPAKGPLAPYLANALRRQLGEQLVRQHAPVSARRSEVYKLHPTRGESLEGFLDYDENRRLDGRQQGGKLKLTPEATQEPVRWVDQILADREWHYRVLTRLTAVVGDDGFDGLLDLLREGPRRTEDGVPVTGRAPWDLEQSRATACIRIAQDPELRTLAKERP